MELALLDIQSSDPCDKIDALHKKALLDKIRASHTKRIAPLPRLACSSPRLARL